jgi:putative transcriptional regulator
MKIIHHPSLEALADYAAGAAGEAESLILATHLALCPACRAHVGALEAVGGALVEAIEPQPLSEAAIDRMLDAIVLDEPLPRAETAPRGAAAARRAGGGVPEPLRSYLPADLADLPWQAVMRGLDEIELPTGGNERTRLLRIKAGATMPRHTHGGVEHTLVLSGGFTDQGRHYGRGDMAVADGAVDHTPVADEGEDCICLTVTSAPLKLTGKLTRFINPFIKF